MGVGRNHLLRLLHCVGLVMAGAFASSASDTVTQFQRVYATAPWYLERPEPEQELRGQLVAQEGPVGPGARGGLRYRLEAEGSAVSVYDPAASSALASLAGSSVVVRGKLVDLGSEGFTLELWVGSAAALPESSGTP